MRILITNDDGIYAPGLWALVKSLIAVGEVIVVAPDREQSAIGTAITLHHPLRVQKVKAEISGIETWAVGGTPGDSVIMGISQISKSKVDLVISGINNGPNTGDDVLISGTVGAALQAYLHGLSAIAVSINELNSPYLEDAAGFITQLVVELGISAGKPDYFLNVNFPGIPLYQIKGVSVTRLSTSGYCDTAEEGYDGRRNYYWLKHQKAVACPGRLTDAWAVEHNNISVTPLHKYLFGKKEPVLKGNLKGLLVKIK
jgi:5'-nucleotidase